MSEAAVSSLSLTSNSSAYASPTATSDVDWNDIVG